MFRLSSPCFAFLLLFLATALEGRAKEENLSHLFSDLQIVEAINKRENASLPYHYNYMFMGGYYNMPSARMNQDGMTAGGFSYIPPYRNYGVTLQFLKRLELGINYRVYIGISDPIMGEMGFGDISDRGAHAKFSLIHKDDGFPSFFPEIAVGAEDFLGTKRFHSLYVVATSSLLSPHLEMSFGWGKGRIKGFFGGVSWSPFRDSSLPILPSLSLMAEWDAIDYENFAEEHPRGRDVRSRVNVGLSFSLFDHLQATVSTLRGKEIAASVTLYSNLGTSPGFFHKVDNPPFYSSPVNREPLGELRREKELAQELVSACFEQGLNVYQITLKNHRELWIQLLNVRYRKREVLKERIQRILSALIPENISRTIVTVEADGIPSHCYIFRTTDLLDYRTKKIGQAQFDVLSPMHNPLPFPTRYEGVDLYKRKKRVGTFTIHPRLLTFFGSSTGKFKYSFGVLSSLEGYLWDQVYYKIHAAYHILSSIDDLKAQDLINPSLLLQVRSDTIRYFQKQTFSLETGYMQKGFSWAQGWYGRFSLGYFEPAYGGAAFECLYYPVSQNWAIGIEGAGLLKRKYKGLGFATTISQFNGTTCDQVPFIGWQYFLDLYYRFRPLDLLFKVSVGQFLARDFGAHFEVAREFPSGFRFSIWYDWTTAIDIVNGKRYQNKGIAFSIPLDFFLRKSSRSKIGYALSVWLRDTGARARTGKRLYGTLEEERSFF